MQRENHCHIKGEKSKTLLRGKLLKIIQDSMCKLINQQCSQNMKNNVEQVVAPYTKFAEGIIYIKAENDKRALEETE